MRPYPVLMYHNVGLAPRGAQVRGLYVRPRAFSRQMALLRLLGYGGLAMGEMLPYLQGKKEGKVCAITFDDGYVDNLELALPILQRHGFKATCYIVSGRIGQHNVWDAERLRVRKPIMNHDQIRRWLDAGMEIGAHTRSHVRLTEQQDAALEEQVAGSRHDLEAAFGVSVTQFCYPWGDHDERVVEAVRAAGYECATTTRRGRARRGVDPLRVPRVAVMRQHLLHAFLLKIVTSYGDRA